ncbi:hypothetical protein [Streptomyces sp. HNM0574]|uniref:hypothetical protein n=1 Tax=Streptomyces sp. HNM0574 TaxID=2714954 RepID=UPI00146B05DB|nr:hypothetical protein [Streptomyces sp. HNM0574]NLU68436.1 hypothetical protein [Streptomyces sp. HNM0574]
MTTVAVADDDATGRGELAAALREMPGVTVTTVCRTDDDAALAEVELAAPDVLLLGSVSAPPQDAWALARRFTGPRPVISVAGYGGFPSPGPLVHTLHGLFPAAASPAAYPRSPPARGTGTCALATDCPG